MIELLTVIAVIGLLAALVTGLSSRAGVAGRQGRIRSELNQLITAIESYKSDFGHYPPDHILPQQNPNDPLVNAVTNQLFYELSGVVVDNANRRFHAAGGAETIDSTTVKTFFNTDGFVNAQTDLKKTPRAYFQPKTSQHAEISRAPSADVEVLVVPVKWPAIPPVNPTVDPRLAWPIDPPVGSSAAEIRRLHELNPWRYVSTRPTNNATSFDLWAEWVEGKQVKILSNWNPDPQERK